MVVRHHDEAWNRKTGHPRRVRHFTAQARATVLFALCFLRMATRVRHDF